MVLRRGLRMVALCLLGLLSLPVFAGEMLVLDVATPKQGIGRGVEVLVDAEKSYRLEDVTVGPQRDAFTPLQASVPSFGFADAAVWLRFSLVNRDAAMQQRLLVVENSWLDHLTVYIQHPDGTTEERHFGDTLPYAAREIDHPLPVFALSVAPGEHHVLLRAEARDPLLVPATLWEPMAFAQHDRHTATYYGVFYGTIGVMLLYNLFLLLALRDRTYFFYVLYLASFLAMNLTYNGFTYELIWREHPEWVNWWHPITIYLYQIAGVLFAISFLATRERTPHLHRFLQGFLVVLGASLLGAGLFGGYHVHVSLSIALVVCYSIAVVAAGLISLWQGNRSARFFIIGTTSSLVGASVTALVVAGLLPFHFATFHAVEFGMMLDVILLSMALADRYHILRRERDEVEARYYQSLAHARDALEAEVDARTRELEQAKERAEDLARTDALTRLNNRRAFHDYGTRAFNVARRHAQPLSLIMLDLDHFKAINDTYGHAAGDLVLAEAARVLQRTVRNTDILGRIGGEEFAIALPQTLPTDACALAEKLRASIEALCVAYEHHQIRITASAGVASMSAEDEVLDDLIGRADKMLYAAKQSGRNQIVAA